MTDKINIISLFSGIGMQEFGMNKVLGVERLNMVNFCEYDSTVAQIFSILHHVPIERNLGDITSLNIPKYIQETKCDIDIVISTFPCQSFSIAGKKQGFEDKSKGNMFDIGLELINGIQPKVVVYENVKNILNAKFDAVNKISTSMSNIGYTCYHRVLNSKDFGIPQNRSRWFMVSIRDDIDDGQFMFPEPIPLCLKVRDFVDIDNSTRECSSNMTEYFDDKYHKVYKSKNNLVKVFDGVESGHFKSGFTGHRIYSIDGVAPTFTTSNDCHFVELKGKLTVVERWKLMGLNEEDLNRLQEQKPVSSHILHKICGNGLVVDVFEFLFKEIVKYL